MLGFGDAHVHVPIWWHPPLHHCICIEPMITYLFPRIGRCTRTANEHRLARQRGDISATRGSRRGSRRGGSWLETLGRGDGNICRSYCLDIKPPPWGMGARGVKRRDGETVGHANSVMIFSHWQS